MFRNIKSDYLNWIIIIGAIILALEILFFNRGIIFSLFISVALIYLGRQKAGRKRRKLLFFGGIIFLVGSILNMLAFKFFLLAVLLHFFIQFFHSKRNPKKMSLNLQSPEPEQGEMVIKSKPLLENVFFGHQKTSNGVYEWNDINIQVGVGDTIIDLSYTMLPKGETVIFIRNIIGNIQILVPYEIEVNIYHSVIAGSTAVFGHREEKIFNQVYQLKTPGYEKAEQKVKIFTSLVVGNLEVGRI